jgi:DNA polymerase-3 subunit alpha
MLDGASRLDELVRATDALGMSAIAITDHGNMFGAYGLYETTRSLAKAGVDEGGTSRLIKPIIGLESYLTPKTKRQERKKIHWGQGGEDDVSGDGAFTHMTIWAEDTAGMHNLFKLSSRSAIEGFFYKPRADRELLHEYAKGLIATTGCPSGEVQTYLRLGMYEQALASAAEFQDIFGAGNFYVELMDHSIPVERRVRDDLLKLAKDLSLPLVATNDLHYVHQQDAQAHDLLLCVNSGSTVDTPGRFKFDGDTFYLRSPAEMRALFQDLPEACDNTLAIAERCNISFTEGMGTFMVRAEVPEGETEASWFVKEVQRGLELRWPGGVPDYAREQAAYEQEVIISKGYAGYFLVVADFINWAKDHGISVGPGRGSGAGSMCAYALRITELDPVRHGLIFERFLNPERPSMPDFDIDFDDRRRGEVIKYVTDKYGEDHVSQIVTYGTIKAKQAIRDAARVLGKSYALGEMLTKAFPKAEMGKELGFARLFNPEDERYAEGHEFRDLMEQNPEAAEVVAAARGLENLKRQWGVHAAGIIMSSEPLAEVIPIMRREADGAIITQFDYHACEALGLVKMDFLGLSNLTIIDDALANIKANKGEEVDLDELAATLDDPQTYTLLASGETLGVFQLESGGMRNLLKLMRPTEFEDISAVNALFRPGPMGADSHTNYALRKNGQQPIQPIHPELEEPLREILEPTYGLIVYQEQVQQIARKVAGYTLGAADELRRAMGKKKKAVLDAEYPKFEAGMTENGFSKAAVKALWDVLVPFSDYAFNKAHTAAYGLISYWTAYLKAHYPVEYMAALLEGERNNKDKTAAYLGECRRLGIEVLSPDVNESELAYTPIGDAIRFGLGAIKNVGVNVVKGIIDARAEHGKAKDFNEFLTNVPAVVLNKRVLESLIKAGAFDSMGHTRRALMEVFEDKMAVYLDSKHNAQYGQDDLFGGLEGIGGGVESAPVPDLPEWEKMVRLGFEREMLGMYVSDHPLKGLQGALQRASTTSIAAINGDAQDRPSAQGVTIAGMVTGIDRKVTKQGKTWAVVRVEDLDSAIEVMAFPKVYEDIAASLRLDAIVAITGRLHEREERMELRADSIKTLSISADSSQFAAPIVISISTRACTPELVARLKQVLAGHPGDTEVQLETVSLARERKRFTLPGIKVADSSPLAAELKALLGPECLR